MTVNAELAGLFHKTRTSRDWTAVGRGKECQHHVGILE